MTPPPPMEFRTFADAGPDDDDPGPRRPVSIKADLARPAAGPLSRRAAAIVLLFAGLMLLPALGGSLRVLTQHEVFAAQTAREMISAGDWVLPHFAGVPRRNKPPGMYWLIAASMTVFQSRAEWVARLPAALAGVLTALLVADLAARWLGNFVGLIAGLMQASLAYVLMQARLAEADMPMAAAVAVAMTAFARAVVVDPPVSRGRKAAWAVVFGVAVGASVVLKGVGIVFVLAGCLLWVLSTRRWSALRFLFHPAAVVPLVVIAGAWPLAVYLRDPSILAVWRQETFGRAGGEFGPSEPWHTYFSAVPFLTLPWLPFAVVGLAGWWAVIPAGGRRWDLPRRHPRATFLACWFAGGMAVLLVSAAKHKHYAIPMLPPITIVAAAGFARWLQAAGRRDGRSVLAARVATAGVSVAGAAGVAVLLAKGSTAKVELAVAVAVISLGVVIAIRLYAAGRGAGTVVACFGTALAGGLIFQFAVLPKFDDYKASATLARRANELVPPGETIYLLKLGEAQPAYYLDRPLVRVDRMEPRPAPRPGHTPPATTPTSEGLQVFMASSSADRLYVLCPETVTPLLAAFGTPQELDRVDHLRKTEKDETVLIRLDRRR